MSFNYFEADVNKGQKYARLYPPKNQNDLSCHIVFEELQIQETETHYILTGKIKQHTAGIEKSFKEHNAQGEIVIIRVLRVPEIETSFKGEKKTTKQSPLEQYLVIRLKELDLTKAYSGGIRFRYDGMIGYLLEGKLDANLAALTNKECFDLTPVDNKTFELEEIKSGNGGNYSKGNYKSESEKLTERMNFKLKQLSLVCGVEIPDFKTFMNLVDSEPDMWIQNLEWLDKLIK